MFKRLLPSLGRSQRGQSTVEVLIVVAVLAVVAQSAALIIRNLSRQNVDNRDRAYAMEKALQMLEEMRGLVLDEVAGVDVLDEYGDGRKDPPDNSLIYKYTLSTKTDVVQPDPNTTTPDYQTAAHAVSNNWIRNSGYVFVRHIDVITPLDSSGKKLDENMRKIYVRVYRAKPNGGKNALNPDSTVNEALPRSGTEAPLAEVFGIVRSLGALNQPTQMLDVHLIALENVPGWWSRTSNLIPLMQSSLVSLQSRNPGLKIRTHWIRRMSFGRDLEYTPETNQSVLASASGAFKKAYVYPGYISYDDADDFYYSVDWFKARMNIDGTVEQREGYALADQWNHAMRYPDEQHLYDIMKTVAANKGEVEPEMSLRMLLEKMNNNSADLRNAIVINLHGEMVPVLPLRNISDAAKDPLTYIGRGGGKADRAWRAVSHPERLSYNTGIAGQETQAVRVYAYDMNPPGDPISVANEDDIIDVVTLFVPGGTLANLKQVERVQGNSRTPYWKHYYDDSNWLSSGGGLYVHDGLGVADSTWVADEYTAPSRGYGLRIRLFGVTPTARAYNGPHYVP